MNNVVFLVGAGRSGTTLLYKLLALHQDIAVFNNYDSKLLSYSPTAHFMRAIRRKPELKRRFWFGSGGNAYFTPGLDKLFPYPVEGEPLYAHCGVPLVIDPDARLGDNVGECLKQLFAKTLARQGGSVFLSKRTANNRRLTWLREVFPEARYINLMRDGREVAHSLSTVNWWEDHTVWWSGKTPRVMEAEGWDRLDIAARNWVEEVSAMEAGLQGLAPEKRLDLRYETLLEDPIAEIRKLLEFMSLEPSERFFDVVRTLQLKNRPAKWRSKWDQEQTERVESIERDLLTEHGYI